MRAILSYVDVTKDKRSENKYKLFLALKKCHMSVSTETISRWLKEMLQMAGISNKFTAHSTQAASTSAAKCKGVSVLRAGNWSQESTFNRFNSKTITNPAQNTTYTQVLFCTKEKQVSHNCKHWTTHCHICSLIMTWN